MLTDYAATNGNELWNTTRLQAYLTNVGSPFDSGPDICTCPTLTPEVLGHTGPYTTPDDALSPAPWFDVDVTESAEFLGFLPLSIDGIDDNLRARQVSGALGGGGVFGPTRDLPRTMTVSGVIIGSTCCGAAYGLHWLAEALASCTGSGCDGDCFTMYNCCPDPGLTADQFNAAHRRTFRRTSLVSGPIVTRRRASASCDRSNCSAGAELIDVEFVLVAATPWAWTDPIPVLSVTPPIADPDDCIVWCLSGETTGPHSCNSSECLFQDCSKPTNLCGDPRASVPTPPQPKLPASSFCAPLGPERACYSIDLSTRPQWATDVPLIQVYSGATALRNVRVTFYEKPEGATDCDAIADANLCNAAQDFTVTYIPPRTTITLDGPVGQATILCDGECQTASTAYGNQDGGPVRVSDLTCAQYCVCIETDSDFPPAADALVVVSVVGRGY